MRGVFSRALGAGVMVFALAGCASGDGGGSGSGDDAGGAPGGPATDAGPARFVSDDALTVCVDAPKYPFAFQSPGGDWLGSDIEVVEHLAAELDRELVVVPVPFDGIWRRPAAAECDLAVAAITITDARRAEAAFTRSYLDAGQALAVRTEDEGAYALLADLGGQAIGVKAGTTSEEYLRGHLPAGASLVTYPDTEAMFIALGAREVEAVLADLPIAGYRSTLDAALSVTEIIDTDEHYGLAAASSNTGLVATVDEALAAYLAGDDYRSLLSRWFGIR
ncbi:MAG: ABC transporter substrate-binding protein [Dehalococcoidia bacterium]